MKSSQIAIGALLALCAGCATKEMSSTPFYTGHEVTYTGRVEDRVNLWPVAYYREPVGSIAWPLLSFSNDHFAFRPLYSQYQKHGEKVYNEFNVLWPIAQFDTHDENYRIFPFFWGDGNFCLFPEVWKMSDWWGVFPFFMDNDADWVTVFPLFFSDFAGSDRFHTLFPLYYHSSQASKRHETSYFWTALGLWGYKRRDDAFLNHRILPLYFADEDSFWSIPYAHFDEGSTKRNMLLGGLAGWKTTDDHYASSWLFPLFYHNDTGDFASLPWCREKNARGETTFAMVPPLLSWYDRHGSKKETYALLGLGGWRQDGDDTASWLFPFFYNDSSAFATPLFGRTDKGCDWCFPFYWRDADTFTSLLWSQERGKDGKLNWAISPLFLSGYGRDEQTGEETTRILCGLGGKTTTADGHAKSWAFPLFYNDDDLFVTALFGKTKTSDWLVPLYYRDEESFVTPLFGKSGSTSWIAPLLYNDDDLFLTPLYGKTKTSDWLVPLYYHNDEVFATALFGKTKTADWCVPLYYRDEDIFASLFYWQNRDPKTGGQTAVVPPLLGGVTRDKTGTCRSWGALLGLVGGERDAEGRGASSWAFPLYFHDTNTFASALWWYNENPRTGDRTKCVPPLLTGWNTTKAGKVDSWITLAGLAGATYDEKLHKQWFAPLYLYDRDDGFYSLPYSIDGLGAARTNHIFCAGLAKIYTGSRHGAHIPFLFDWKKDRGFDDLLAIQNCDELPQEVTFENVVVTNRKTKAVSTHRKGVYKGETWVTERDRMSIFVSDNNKNVYASSNDAYRWSERQISPKDDTWRVRADGKRGNKLVFNTEWTRRTDFSAVTRKKVKDETSSSSHLLAGLLFSREYEAKPLEKKVKSETRVLWRLWHREEEDGNVTLDMFPGFTYDMKTNGYTKTSFLWRLFRYENDPEKGVSADLLFVPIRRP